MASFVDHVPVVRICFFRQSALIYKEGATGDEGHGFEPSTATAVGIDLRACFSEDEFSLPPGNRLPIPSGVAIEPVTPGIAGFVYSRSGLGAKKGLTVAQGVGIIDPDYRGEIMVWLLNTSKETRIIKRGERIAQLVFQPYIRPRIYEVEQLSETLRGSGGFGHTGRF